MQRWILLFAAILALHAGALAQPGNLIGPPPPDTTVISVPFFGGLFGGTSDVAGFLLEIHVTDPSEVDILGVNAVHPAVNLLVGGIPATISPSDVLFFTAWIPSPTATNSGIFLSTTTTAFDVTVKLLNTNAGTNSDTDFSIFNHAIFHATTSTTIFTSDFFWAGRGQPRQTATSSSFTVSPGSFFAFFTSFTSASFGVQHVPEPASLPLMAGGLLCLVIGLRFRRRRKTGN